VTIWLPVMLIVSSVALIGVFFGNRERRGKCRLLVSWGCIGAFLTYLLWRFDSLISANGELALAVLAFSILLLTLETINGIDYCVYLLIKSRKADRPSEANRMEADLRARDPTSLRGSTS
jgi:hypothetical protein